MRIKKSNQKVHTTNYFNTFIEVADDCKASRGEIPRSKTGKPSIAELEFELIAKHPYKFTSDDILFQVYATRNDIMDVEKEVAREVFFAKGQACLRASPLTKRFGFGIHSNADGKIALYGKESDEYESFINDPAIKKVKAMRSSRKKL